MPAQPPIDTTKARVYRDCCQCGRKMAPELTVRCKDCQRDTCRDCLPVEGLPTCAWCGGETCNPW